MILTEWLQEIIENKTKAYNKVTTNKLALCFNFLQIPDTKVIVMTMTVMKNKSKKNAMHPTFFSKLLFCIEQQLLDTQCEEASFEESSELEQYFFSSMKSKLSNRWYSQLNCHRIFFIPDTSLWNTINTVFHKNTIQMIREVGISEVSVFIDTDNHDCNMKFF